MKLITVLSIAVLMAGCASDPVAVSNKPGQYRDAKDVFVQDAIKSGMTLQQAECIANETEKRLDPIVLSRLNAAARGEITLTKSEAEQIRQINYIRLQNDQPTIRAACGV